MIKIATKFFRASALTVFLGACGTGGSQAINFKEQIDVGEQFVKAGQHDRAYGILQGLSESSKNSANAQIQVGNAYLRSNALLRANQAYAKAAKLGAAKDADLGFGKVALKRNDPEKAQAHFAKVLQRDKRNIEALNGIGVAYDLSGNHSLAQQSYRLALGVQPNAYQAMNNLGLSMVLSGNSAGAVNVLTELAESRLDSPTSRLNLAIALSKSGNTDAALKLAGSEVPEEQAVALFKAVKNYKGQSS